MKIHTRMSMNDRAAQFMPFAALKGFTEALARAEKQAEDNAEKRAVRIYVAHDKTADK